MITQSEQDALTQYIEFLLVKSLLEPIVDKHIADRDVVNQCYETVYSIVNELENEMANIRHDAHVVGSKISK